VRQLKEHLHAFLYSHRINQTLIDGRKNSFERSSACVSFVLDAWLPRRDPETRAFCVTHSLPLGQAVTLRGLTTVTVDWRAKPTVQFTRWNVVYDFWRDPADALLKGHGWPYESVNIWTEITRDNISASVYVDFGNGAAVHI